MPSLAAHIQSDHILSNEEHDRFLDTLSPEQLLELAKELDATREQSRQQNQLLYYEPVSAEAIRFHCSMAPQRVILGGNGSSKSETNLVDLVINLTGEVPISLDAVYPRQKLRPPINSRIVLQSLTSTWQQAICPKLQWNHWTGMANGIGHWGWIPRRFLKNGKWEDSWSAQYRTLTLTNGSTLQIFSHDQETQDFASASVHDIRMDEGPKQPIYRENLLRLREGGYISTALTPPDDEAKAWQAAWIYDELYQRGLPGPAKDPFIDAFTFHTENNRFISQETIATIIRGLTPMQREVRLHGAFMHLGGRIYSTYTDRPQTWCFTCNEACLVVESQCATCHNTNIVPFCHFIEPFEQAYTWPCIFVLDPHPRKPHTIAWYTVSPSDDLFQVSEMEVDAECEVVRDMVADRERTLGLSVVRRIIDPNMGMSASGTTNKRGRTVRDEFDAVGLRCDLADDNRETARGRLRAYLKPDPRTKAPRFSIFQTCPKSNYQMQRYVWGEWATSSSHDKNPKAMPAELNSDFPACHQYLINSNPTFANLNYGTQRHIRQGRKHSY